MSFDYLASPYSHADVAVRAQRYNAALRAAAHLMAKGRVVFSPIAHMHPIDPYVPRALANEHCFWMRQDIPLLRHASSLIVLMLPGWEQSRGVSQERDVAAAASIPVDYLQPLPEWLQ